MTGEPIVDAHIKQLAQMASESNDSFGFMIFQNLILVARCQYLMLDQLLI